MEICPLFDDYHFCVQSSADAVFTKQKRMQAMIVTSQPDKIIEKIHKRLHRGATIIHNAEGTYNHQEKAVLLTVITRAEFNEFKFLMKKRILKLLLPYQKMFILLDVLSKWRIKKFLQDRLAGIFMLVLPKSNYRLEW